MAMNQCIGSLLVCAGLAAAVVPGFSAPKPEVLSVALTYDDFQKDAHPVLSLKAQAGGTFTVTLFSNPTTGYRWDEQAAVGDPKVLRQADHRYQEPASPAGMTGAGGKEIWTFQALKAGSTTIRLEYGQPWDGGAKKTWTLAVNVTVP